eukprot:snap_masked-scaffold_43-processed-gene-0.23-mRNA-1 protein AED:1.00 eAED:1.00 QI:0/0/0/0/1/1/3/0/345
MANTSIECQVDADCPGTTFCVENLWFSETQDGSGCMCARLYGWHGEDCEKLGTGTLAILFKFLLADHTQVKYQALQNQENSTKYLLGSKRNLKLKAARKNAFRLKAQLLYLLIVLCIFLTFTNITYILTSSHPQKVNLEGDWKVLYYKDIREWLVVIWMTLYFTACTQLALSWLSIGFSASLTNSFFSKYFRFRLNLVRFFQILIVSGIIVMKIFSDSVWFVAIISFFVYSILLLYLYKGRNVLSKQLEETQHFELLRQARLVKKYFFELRSSVTLFFLSIVPLIILGFFEDSFPIYILKTIYPKEGGINYFFLLSQILRQTAAISLVRDILKYCEEAEQTSPKM